jgi:hypothetical protein
VTNKSSATVCKLPVCHQGQKGLGFSLDRSHGGAVAVGR